MKTIQSHRFTDKGHMVYGFLDRIFVHCPKCSKRAVITKNGKHFYGDVELRCTNCHYYQLNRKFTYVQEIKFNCPNCAFSVIKKIESVKTRKQAIKMSCPKCEASYAYKPRYIKKELFYRPKEGKDPFLSLPLWLTGNLKNKMLWAYNYEHLNYLEHYIGANIRSRHSGAYSSMLERLPSWVKARKNREKLIKVINKIKKK